MHRKGKHLDFELNLIPFIDLLSVCICFLLLTAVWLNIGSMNVKQAVGGQPASETAKKPVVWVRLNPAGEVAFDVQDTNKVPGALRKMKILGLEGKVNLKDLLSYATSLKTAEPTMTTALIQPSAVTAFEEIIDVMDQFKKAGLIDLGVAPL